MGCYRILLISGYIAMPVLTIIALTVYWSLFTNNFNLYLSIASTLIELPFTVGLIIYKKKTNSSIFSHTNFYDYITFFFVWSSTFVTLINALSMGICLEDENNVNFFVKDRYKILYGLMIASTILHFIFLVIWMREINYMNLKDDKPKETDSEVERKNNKNVFKIALIIIFNLMCAVGCFYVLVENRDLLQRYFGVFYLLSWFNLIEWPLLVITIVYYYYNKIPFDFDFQKNSLLSCYIRVILFLYTLSLMTIILSITCILPNILTTIMNVNKIYFYWLISITILNGLIYNIFAFKSK